MKILTLEINNIRGIRHFEHDFRGKNAVILGPNGTGKSSILDAIDFLLTGEISRLTGVGTSGISLKRHGTNINASGQPEKSFVKASIQFNENAQAISIERYVSNPKELVCDEDTRSQLETVCRLAEQGQHVLERRQLLKFVHVSSNDRAEQIQTLLNLEVVERTRRSLGAVTRQLRDKRNAQQREFEKAQNNVKTDLELESCEYHTVLEAANRYRADLGLESIETLSKQTIKHNIGTDGQSEEVRLSPAHLLNHIDGILETIAPENLTAIGEMEESLRNKLAQIRSDLSILRSMKRIDLYRLGIELIETDACPLCDSPLKQQELKNQLRSKIESANYAKTLLDKIKRSSKDLRDRIDAIETRLREEFPWSNYLTNEEEIILNKWRGQLGSLTDALQNSLEYYPREDLPIDQVARLFVDEPLRSTVVKLRDNLQTQVNEYANTNDVQDIAREKLTLLARDWPALRVREQEYHKAEVVFNRSAILQNAFVEIRDEVLDTIYQSVSGEFARLYRRLHKEDESLFRAKMYPREAGLHLDVDFYGRGMFPPNALHSEGHQDSMGLCLFLVLSERLSGTDLQLLLLDDVIMSVDAGHRKQVARVLVEEFANRQIVLTTYDKIWAQQLENEGFATGSNIVEIQRWTVDTGPIYREVPPAWNLIENDLASNQTNAAGNKLRAWAESFSKQVCHNLRAPVPFLIDGRYPLADVLYPALSSLRKTLNKAINKARASQNTELVDKLEWLKSERDEVFQEIEKEHWVVNWASHDNSDDILTSGEVADAVDAFRRFYDLVHCPDCSGMVELTARREVLLCPCGNVSWPL